MLSKFILLDYNSQDGLVEYVEREHSEALSSGKLVVYSFLTPTTFHMTHAKNMVHRLAMIEGCDILCNLDADNITGQFFDMYIAEQFRDKSNVFLWAKMFTQKDGRRPRGISGRIIVTSKAFLRIGGYDEKFETWNHDDKDFNIRLRRNGMDGIEIPEHHLDVVLHTNKMRFKDYPHAVENDAETNDNVDPQDVIANYGKVGCGTVYRNFDYSRPTMLRPIPTRIFGIGMHKTGTTSLHTALKRLGYDSGHWKDAHWAKAIYDEMMQRGKSWTVERSYALSDLPITILYKELDRAYRGSKFILTLRSEDGWLRSVANHWSHTSNPYRSQWSNDPFSHRIHKIIYGQKGFDADKFLARYRRHNQEVIEYFSNRPNDLLVMDMNNGAGWPELCMFLGCPIPNEPYPKKLITPQ
jgi:hypothetical protein